MLKYKLTKQDNTTYNNTKWEIGKPIETDGKIKSLCSSSWLHFYHTPELGILMNPSHANIINPRLYECEAEGEILDNDYGLKAGCTKMTLIREVEKPVFNHRQLVNIILKLMDYVIVFIDNNEIRKNYDKVLKLTNTWLKDSYLVSLNNIYLLYLEINQGLFKNNNLFYECNSLCIKLLSFIYYSHESYCTAFHYSMFNFVRIINLLNKSIDIETWKKLLQS